MTAIAGGSIVVVCMTVVTCLVLLLRHLESLHLSTTQADELKALIVRSDADITTSVELLDKDLEATNVKLSALSNRVR